MTRARNASMLGAGSATSPSCGVISTGVHGLLDGLTARGAEQEGDAEQPGDEGVLADAVHATSSVLARAYDANA